MLGSFCTFLGVWRGENGVFGSDRRVLGWVRLGSFWSWSVVKSIGPPFWLLGRGQVAPTRYEMAYGRACLWYNTPEGWKSSHENKKYFRFIYEYREPVIGG